MIHRQPYKVYIASCDRNGGIYQFNLDEDGNLGLMDKVALDRPMYMSISNNKLYTLLRAPLQDSTDSGVVSFEVARNGALTQPGPLQSTMGREACHLTIEDETIYCANYTSGSIIRMPDRLITHQGCSVHPTRQTSAHVHQVIPTPEGQYLCVVDLGLDKVFVYDKALNYISDAEVPKGHGPRHMVFSPDGELAFCANELKSTVTVFYYSSGQLNRLKTYHALPKGYAGESTVAAIRITADGRFLYVSNRGHDSISCFKISGSELELFAMVDCGGQSPRDFNITPDGRFMISTNENSDNVTVFKITEGRLSKLDGETKIKKPLCVIFYDD